jgi:hypothetical protein
MLSRRVTISTAALRRPAMPLAAISAIAQRRAFALDFDETADEKQRKPSWTDESMWVSVRGGVPAAAVWWATMGPSPDEVKTTKGGSAAAPHA